MTKHVVQVGDLSDNSRRFLRIGTREIALFCVAGKFFALDDSCPHAGASLSGGLIEGGKVRCRAHGLAFDLATGCMGRAGLSVKTYPVTVSGETVTIEI